MASRIEMDHGSWRESVGTTDLVAGGSRLGHGRRFDADLYLRIRSHGPVSIRVHNATVHVRDHSRQPASQRGPHAAGMEMGGRNDNTNPKGIDDGIKIKDQKDAVVRPEVPGCRLPVPTESPNPVRSFFFYEGPGSGRASNEQFKLWLWSASCPRSQEDFHADQRLSCGFWRERSRNKLCLVNEQQEMIFGVSVK